MGEPHKNHFNSLRLYLALLVIISHCWPFTQGSNTFEPLYRLTRGQLTMGEVAIDLFFAISGCLVLASWLRAPQVRIFAWKRFCRIAPGYYLAAVVCGSIYLLCFGPLPLAAYLSTVAQFGMLNAPGSFPDNPTRGLLNGPTWSIRYEIWAYALIPLLAWLGAYSDRRWLVPLALTVALGLFAWQLSGLAPDFLRKEGFRYLPLYFRGEWPRLLSCFLLGMLFTLYRHRIPLNLTCALTAVALLALTAALGKGLHLLFTVAGSYLLFYVAFHPRLRLPNTGKADYSYGLYLYAGPIQQLLAWRFPGLGPVLMMASAVPLAWVCAWASWHWIEAPALSLKQKPQQPPDTRADRTGMALIPPKRSRAPITRFGRRARD